MAAGWWPFFVAMGLIFPPEPKMNKLPLPIAISSAALA